MLDDKLILRTLDFSKESSEKFSDFIYDEVKIVNDLYYGDFSSDNVMSAKPKEGVASVASFNASRFNVLRAEMELEGADVTSLREDKSVHEIDNRPALTSIPKYIEAVGADVEETLAEKQDDYEFER